jgi:ABC-2 type transport system ATP-binding protein
VSALVVEDFSKSYKQLQAVDGLSFEVKPGDVLALVGPNGAGKTTTMRTIAGIIAPTQGRIRIDGFDIVEQAIEAKRRLAYVPDDPHLFDALTVEEHLVFAAAAYRVDDWKERAEALLARFDLTEHRTKPAIELSRGMRQKVAICCAYLHRPALVMLDEPLTGLDPLGIHRMKLSIVAAAGRGAAVIVSSHLLHLVEEICTRILILNRGVKVADGTLAELAAQASAEGTTLERIFLGMTGPGG